VNQQLDRRTFLRRGAVGTAAMGVLGAGGLSSLLAACGTSSGSSAGSSGSGNLGTYSFQASWIKNVEFAGEYIADTNGYYRQAGFSGVNLISGGPSVDQDAVVAAGKAMMGVSSPDTTSAAILKGAPLIILGAQYQKNPFAVMSLTTSPIHTPPEMYGKKIGVQSTNESVWNAFLKANNLDPSRINKVPVQFDPTPLAQHEVDGWFSYITNEPNLLKVKGIDTVTFMLADNNYPLVAETYMVTKDTLSSSRSTVKAALKAEIMGWRQAVSNPALGAHLTVTNYGKSLGLSEAEQTLEAEAQNQLVHSGGAVTDGLFTIASPLIDQNIATLAVGGINIKASQLFDMTPLSEVYQENPSLKEPIT
jgi:ABC-type nitrate/sulfonate/bicarbonate transport system substrate-binding protein